jgi:exonuclease SbcD
VSLFGEWLAELRAASAQMPIVIIAGNHDSAKRIGWARDLAVLSNVHLRGDPETVEDPIRFETQAGEAVEVWALPFAWAGDLPAPDGEASTQASAFATGMHRIAERRDASRTQVLVAHCFAQGGHSRDSERVLIGSATLIDPAQFQDFDYVALGHLHAPQEVVRNAWYSGSPLGYSFSEESDDKGTLLVDCARDRHATIRRLPLTPLHPLRRVTATMEQLLDSHEFDAFRDAYLEVTLSEETLLGEPMALLRGRFPFVLHLKPPAAALIAEDVEPGDRGAPADLATDLDSFWHHIHGEPPSKDVVAAFAACRTEVEGAS